MTVSKFIDKCLESKPKEGHILFYRGEHRKYDRLLPAIYNPNYSWINNEDTIYKQTTALFPDEFNGKRYTIEKLIVMQHYGIPTRILDISKNPLVGLFFACYANGNNETLKEDGRVYVFSIPQIKIKFCDSSSVAMTANICKLPPDRTKIENNRFSATDFGKYLMHEIQLEIPHFEPKMDIDDVTTVHCLCPNMNNQRILRQDGCFFVFGISNAHGADKTKCAEFPKEWILDEIRIPHGNKNDILNALQCLNAGESFLFPDFSHLANEFIKRYSIRR
jgi:hypothetical protein